MKDDKIIRSLIREMLSDPTAKIPVRPPRPLNIERDRIGIITIKGSYFSKLTVVFSVPELYRLARWYAGKLEGEKDKTAGDLVISGVEWGMPDTGGPPCNGANVVRRTVTAFPGGGRWGQVAYIAALDEVKELGPDRGTVLPEAERVWKKLATGQMGVKVEANPYVDWKDYKGNLPKNACVVHPDRPFLNASYRLKGSIPAEILEMKRRGEYHLNNIRELYGATVIKKLQILLYQEFGAVFENS